MRILKQKLVNGNKPIRDCVVNGVGLQLGLPNSVQNRVLVLVEETLSQPSLSASGIGAETLPVSAYMTCGPHVASDRIYGARCGALRYSRYCLGHFLKPIFLRELRNEKAFFARFQMDGRYSGRGRMYGLCGRPVQCEAHQSSPKPRGVPEVTAKRVYRPHEECAFPAKMPTKAPGIAKEATEPA